MQVRRVLVDEAVELVALVERDGERLLADLDLARLGVRHALEVRHRLEERGRVGVPLLLRTHVLLLDVAQEHTDVVLHRHDRRVHLVLLEARADHVAKPDNVREEVERREVLEIGQT